MRTYKICIIAKYFLPFDTRLCQQIKVLNKYKIPCDIICVGHHKQKSVEYYEGSTVYHVFKMKDKKKSFANYLIDSLNFLLAATLKLALLSFKNSYKVIFVHTLPEFIVFTTLIQKCSGSKVVLDARDLTVDLLESRWPGIDIAIKKVTILTEKMVACFCNEIITASNGFKKSLQKRGVPEHKITVIVNTADESIYKFVEYKEKNIISENAKMIYHGTVAERFGIIVLVEAMSIICKYIPYSTLQIFGMYDPQYRIKIENVIKTKKLEEAIILKDAVSHQEIYRQLLQMDMGVVPYLSDNFMNLALSTKTFEYIASGLPVVASRLESSEELFNDSCIYYAEPGNPEDLARKVIEVCTNPDVRLNKRKCAYEVYNSTYTSKIQYEKYLNIISTYAKDEFVIKRNVEKTKLVDA